MEWIKGVLTGGEAAITSFLQAYGAWSLLLVLFVSASQTGFVLGPLLPGTTVLFICGVFSRNNPEIINPILCALTALVGGAAGCAVHYGLGAWAGPRLFVKERGPFARQNLTKTEEFFTRHGKSSLLLAPSVPIVRTFASVVAGAGSMAFLPFLLASSGGVAFWVATAFGGGFLVGAIPGAKMGVILAAGAFSLFLGLKVIYSAWKSRSERPLEPQPEEG